MNCIRVLITLVALASGSVQAGALTAQQILERSYQASRLTDSSAEVRMLLRNRAGKERVRELAIFTKLQGAGPDSMIALYFRSPADLKGTSTLLIQRANAQDDMWVYLPALRKSRRLFSDNKRDSFMGSDLSYGDILGHRPVDWVPRLLREDELDGHAVYVVEATPATPAVRASSGYSMRVLSIDKGSLVALKSDYLDEQGRLLKSISVSDVKPMGAAGKFQFMKLEAEQLQTGSHTTLVYTKFQHDTGLGEALFTTAAMERGLR